MEGTGPHPWPPSRLLLGPQPVLLPPTFNPPSSQDATAQAGLLASSPLPVSQLHHPLVGYWESAVSGSEVSKPSERQGHHFKIPYTKTLQHVLTILPHCIHPPRPNQDLSEGQYTGLNPEDIHLDQQKLSLVLLHKVNSLHVSFYTGCHWKQFSTSWEMHF